MDESALHVTVFKHTIVTVDSKYHLVEKRVIQVIHAIESLQFYQDEI